MRGLGVLNLYDLIKNPAFLYKFVLPIATGSLATSSFGNALHFQVFQPSEERVQCPGSHKALTWFNQWLQLQAWVLLALCISVFEFAFAFALDGSVYNIS